MRAELVLDALSAALGSREPADAGLIFHADQGSQYKATRVREALLIRGLEKAAIATRGPI